MTDALILPFITTVWTPVSSGVNSDPADPAGGGPRGPKLSGKNFFTQQFACTLKCWCCGNKLQW